MLALWTVYILCQPKIGGSRPPLSPLSAENQKLAYPPSPLSDKIRNWLTPPPPLSEIKYCCTLINLVKPTFLKEISNFETNQTYVKHNKKEHLRKNLGWKCDIFREKQKVFFTILHVYSDLAPLVRKIRNGLTHPPPLVRKI